MKFSWKIWIAYKCWWIELIEVSKFCIISGYIAKNGHIGLMFVRFQSDRWILCWFRATHRKGTNLLGKSRVMQLHRNARIAGNLFHRATPWNPAPFSRQGYSIHWKVIRVILQVSSVFSIHILDEPSSYAKRKSYKSRMLKLNCTMYRLFP